MPQTAAHTIAIGHSVANFGKNPDICKQFEEKQANEEYLPHDSPDVRSNLSVITGILMSYFLKRKPSCQ